MQKDNKTTSILKLPQQERPYEKCLSCGPGQLSDAELLSIILRSGASGENVLDLARRILEEQKPRGLLGLYHCTTEELTRIRGVGPVKALQLLCVAELSRRIARTQAASSVNFRDPDTIAAYYMEDFRHEEQEKLMIVLLNSKGSLIGEEILSRGTVNATLISPREIFICALRRQAVSLILMHNHPSGIPEPSKEDIQLTRRVREAGNMIGIELLDHIIIGDQRYISLYREGLL